MENLVQDNGAPGAFYAGLAARERSVIFELMRSENARNVYVACTKVCLNKFKAADLLFGRVMRAAMRQVWHAPESPEVWLFSHFHRQWMAFSSKRPKSLGPHEEHVFFDWKIPQSRQADDALMLLKPLEREIYVYRFFFKFTTDTMSSITGMPEEKILRLFHNAMVKVLSG